MTNVLEMEGQMWTKNHFFGVMEEFKKLQGGYQNSRRGWGEKSDGYVILGGSYKYVLWVKQVLYKLSFEGVRCVNFPLVKFTRRLKGQVMDQVVRATTGQYENKCICSNIHIVSQKYKNCGNEHQAGAELSQAQLKLGFGFTSVY